MDDQGNVPDGLGPFPETMTWSDWANQSISSLVRSHFCLACHLTRLADSRVNILSMAVESHQPDAVILAYAESAQESVALAGAAAHQCRPDE